MNPEEQARREAAAQRAAELRKQGDATGWFDVVYASAAGDATAVPWAHLRPNPLLVEWLERERVDGNGKPALVVGCGLGDDAAALAQAGFTVTAFDISPTAIAWAASRFPDLGIDFRTVDLFQAPEEWDGAFDLVLEAYTLQALPEDVRRRAIERIARFPAPGGRLLVICRGREPEEEVTDFPRPLTRAELDRFRALGLTEESFEDLRDPENAAIRHFRVVYRR